MNYNSPSLSSEGSDRFFSHPYIIHMGEKYPNRAIQEPEINDSALNSLLEYYDELYANEMKKNKNKNNEKKSEQNNRMVKGGKRKTKRTKHSKNRSKKASTYKRK